ncbi:MAG: hypothetical protein ABIJ81_02440 [Patescibacteria group bacterium]
MKKAKIAYFLILILTLITPVSPLAAAADFNPNYILSDQDLFDYQSLDLNQILKFMQDKGSTLTTYVDPITSMVSADIINRAAQEYRVNPKYLLALLQKEQSLIENKSPSTKRYDWATGYGICDSCSMDDPKLIKYKGFFNQVFAAAKFARLLNDEDLKETGKTFSGFGPGISKVVDGTTVIPANNATAILYTYTPHLQGNELLLAIWSRYFSRSYPEGSLLNVEGQKEVWLIQNGFRRQFGSRAVYLSYYQDPKFDRVLNISETELKKYPEGNKIIFPVYSFLRSPKGTVYLLLPNDVIRGFASGEALRQIGINPEEIEDVTFDDLAAYNEGTPITVESKYPTGTLIQDTKSGGIYFVQDGAKHPIFSKEILNSNFSNRKVTKRLSPEELKEFVTSDPVLFKEGDLVKNEIDPTVYVISNKKKRPIGSEEAFNKLGFKWNHIVVTNQASLGLHETGEPVLKPF